jgi:ribonuclease HI
MEKILEIHSDGGCSGNPGPGGWCFILRIGDEQIKGSGNAELTTNNKMELLAVINALKFIENNEQYQNIHVDFYTDSKYVKNGITDWIKRWIVNGWKTASKKSVKNKELWIQLKKLSDTKDITWNWVKGHSDNELNNLCDTGVQEEIKKVKNS